MAATAVSKEHLQSGDRLEQLRADLARKIAQSISLAASKRTHVPGLTPFREVAPTIPWSGTYEPNIGLIVQGRKRVELEAVVNF
jgi:hypothetical protein